MITKGLFSSNTDMWTTPRWLFDKLDEEFHFTVDVCAVAENAKCKLFYSPETDGLSINWGATSIGAILLMDGRLESGSRRRQGAARRPSCSFRREPMRRGSTTTYSEGQKSASCAGGSDSETERQSTVPVYDRSFSWDWEFRKHMRTKNIGSMG